MVMVFLDIFFSFFFRIKLCCPSISAAAPKSHLKVGDPPQLTLPDPKKKLLFPKIFSFRFFFCPFLLSFSVGGRAMSLMAQVNRSLHVVEFEDGHGNRVRLDQEGLSI